MLIEGRRTIIVAVDNDRSASTLQFGTVTLIPDERLVLKDGHPVPFTPKAFDLLAVLAGNPGRLLTKEHLMQAVWPDTVVEESNLTYNIFAIRKALGEGSDSDRYIETVPKRGYRFVAPVVRVEAGGRAPSTAREPAAETLQLSVEGEVPADGATDAARSVGDRSGPRSGLRWPWIGLLAGGALALVALGLRQFRTPSPATTPVHFQEPVMGRLAQSGMFSVSPDGRHYVFAAEGADGAMRLWLRTLGTLQPVPLPGATVFTIIPPVVWSPDSRFVAFDVVGAIRKVGLEGGAPQPICDFPLTAVGGSWNRQGDILLGNAAGGLVRCSSSGGRGTVVTVPAESEEELHLFPSFLSDGRRFVYLRVSRKKPENSGIYASELGAAQSRLGNQLITTGFGASFVAAADGGPGVIVFARDGALFAQRFDERRLEMIGNSIRLADRVGSFLDGAFFSVSPKLLVYRAPDPDFQLAWFDRQGRELERVGKPDRFSGLALSPEGDRALVATHAPQGTANEDLWLFDLSRTAAPRRVTSEPALEFSPTWSTNDQFVFGSGGGASGVYAQDVGGRQELLFKSGRLELPTSMTPDGRLLFYTTHGGPKTGGDIWVRTGEGESANVTPFMNGEHDQSQAELSPDMRWVAYVSNEAGPNEVFVAEFRFDSATGAASPGESLRISEGGGFAPRWRGDGRELFYLTPDGSVMVIPVDAKRAFRPSTATRLFKVPGVIEDWGLAQNGNRFLFAVPLAQPSPFNVVLNWQAMLPK